MMRYYILILLVILFALNMGGANFSASFAPAYGGRIVSKKSAQTLFFIFVFLGAIMMGEPVTETLSRKIIPSSFINLNTLLIILFSAGFSLFIANLLHVPQSTSLVTVGSLLGVGLYFKEFYLKTFLYLIPFWILLPVIAYLLVYYIGRVIYPPRNRNFWVYEKLVNNNKRLKTFVILASCYNAFSIGANNVGNAVGPIAGAGIIEKGLGLLLIAPVFGLGSFVFSGGLNTASERIVPLGLLTATIICLVTGTLMILASILGIPQSFVTIKVAGILAISGLKNGHKITFSNPLTKRTYLTWGITPVIAGITSYFLTAILNSGG